MPAIAAAFSPVTVKPGTDAAARAANSRTDSHSGDRRGRDGRSTPRHAQRGHRELLLPRQVQRRAAGDQDPRPSGGGEQVGDETARGEHLLHVVEDQQDVPLGKVAAEVFQQRCAPRVLQPDAAGDRHRHQRRVPHRGQRHEVHPVAGNPPASCPPARSPAASCRSHPARSASAAACRPAALAPGPVRSPGPRSSSTVVAARPIVSPRQHPAECRPLHGARADQRSAPISGVGAALWPGYPDEWLHIEALPCAPGARSRIMCAIRPEAPLAGSIWTGPGSCPRRCRDTFDPTVRRGRSTEDGRRPFPVRAGCPFRADSSSARLPGAAPS